MPRLELARLVDLLGDDCLRIVGRQDRVVTGAAPIREAGSAEQITFCNRAGEEGRDLIRATRAGVVLCSEEVGPEQLRDEKRTLVVVGAPRLCFLRLVAACFTPERPSGIHPAATVESTASVDPSAYVGPGAYVGPDCTIGAGSVVHGRAYLYRQIRVGRNVTIHAGAVLGADGFGYERNAAGELEKFPHLGGVVIEDEVEIGANTCVDRGTLGDTIIRQGAKVDNLVHIAHNVVVGRHATVIALSMIGGSTVIGERAWIAPSACVRDGLTVGDRATVGLGALVAKDVPPDAVVMGAPARAAEDYKRLLKSWGRLAAEI